MNAPMLVQFVKFGIVGVSNTLLFLAVYTLLLKGFDPLADVIDFGKELLPLVRQGVSALDALGAG